MQVLVATRRTQGERDDDYFAGVEGELVRLPGSICNDPGCGCDRGWAGLSSSKAVTTCEVIESDLDRAGYVAAFRSAMDREGWLGPGEDHGWVDELAAEHLEIATRFPPGSVLRRQGDQAFATRP